MSFSHVPGVYTGLEKNLNSSLPFGQVALKFCLPLGSLRLLFLRFSWQMTCLGPCLGQVRMKSDFPGRKIYLSRTTGRHFFRALKITYHPKYTNSAIKPTGSWPYCEFVIQYRTNAQYDQLPVGLITKLIEHYTGIAEVMGSSPVQARIFSGFLFAYACLSCVNNYEDLSSI